MRVVEIKEIDMSMDLFPRRKEGQDPVRTEGVHLTDVISSIMQDSGISKTVSGGVWGKTELDLAGEVGFLWEEVLEAALKERNPCRFGEVEKDGIIMSPDGIEMLGDEAVLSEHKCRWSSSKHNPTDSFKWMAQVKGYCHALGLQKVVMRILYLNGDWRPPQPQYKGFLIEFTDLELVENWEMVIGQARRKGWVK